MYRISHSLRGYALALIAGILVATLWVNVAPEGYYDFTEWRIVDLKAWLGGQPDWLPPGVMIASPAAISGNFLMALFLFFVGKELWEAVTLEPGPLRGRELALPFGGAVGAALGAVLVWLILANGDNLDSAYGRAAGWPVPVGSDVVLGYAMGRLLLGRGHPALHLLLLSLIGCDLLALIFSILATQPDTPLRLIWLVLPALASAWAWALHGRPATLAPERQRRRGLRLWPYVLAGMLSYLGVLASGLPACLGLLPIIPAIPHATRSFGLFADAEVVLHDPLNRLSHAIARIIPAILFLFGLTHGGMDLAAFAPVTLTVLAAAWLGKPIGYLIGLILAARIWRVRLPQGMPGDAVLRVAVVLGMGFTVPALTLQTALPGGEMQEAARLGLALSLLAGPLAVLVNRLLARNVK